jgi:hypothetical protein
MLLAAAGCRRTELRATADDAQVDVRTPPPLPPPGPLAPHDLAGPYPTIADYCAAVAKDHAWEPDRRCRVETLPPSSEGAIRRAWVLHVNDTMAGAPIATCGLAIETAKGVWVDLHDDANDRCEGIVGPTSSVTSSIVEQGVASGVLRVITRKGITDAHYEPAPKGAKRLDVTYSSSDAMVLCAVSQEGTPRCTPKIVVACTDHSAPEGRRSVQWSFADGVLHLELAPPADEAETPQCAEGEELVLGEFGLGL